MERRQFQANIYLKAFSIIWVKSNEQMLNISLRTVSWFWSLVFTALSKWSTFWISRFRREQRLFHWHRYTAVNDCITRYAISYRMFSLKERSKCKKVDCRHAIMKLFLCKMKKEPKFFRCYIKKDPSLNILLWKTIPV